VGRLRSLAAACWVLGASLAWAAAASAQTGVVALSGETLHYALADPLCDFGDGRAVSLVPHLGALARHAAADTEIVLLDLETGAVQTAEPDLADVVLYDEAGGPHDVADLVSRRGSLLLFETPAGSPDPTSAPLARQAAPSGAALVLYFDRGFEPMPEPPVGPGLAAGLVGLLALRRRRRRPASRAAADLDN
jgi:MYXO-CTERM domain-containing protein